MDSWYLYQWSNYDQEYKRNDVVRVFKYTCDFGNLNVWNDKNKKLWMGSTFGKCFLKMENWNKKNCKCLFIKGSLNFIAVEIWE